MTRTLLLLTHRLQIEVVLNREKEIAREQLALGNKQRALIALRQRKYQETLLTQTDAQLETLQKLVRPLADLGARFRLADLSTDEHRCRASSLPRSSKVCCMG